DLDEALAAARRAVELTPNGHADRPFYLLRLGLSVRRSQSQSPDQLSFNTAYRCFMDAACASGGPPDIKLEAALVASRMCVQCPQFDQFYEKTLRAHASVLKFIPPFIWLGQSISRRFSQLSAMKIGPAITAAASSAICAENFSLALEWLEEGRNIVWAQLTRLRNPLNDLEAHDPDLAHSLRAVSSSLEEAARPSNPYTIVSQRELIVQRHSQFIVSSRIASEDKARKQRELAGKYENLIARIRRIEGFEGFLRPHNIAELAVTCKDGPVIVINVDQSRCDALVLCRPGKVVLVPLPSFSLHIALNMRSKLNAHLTGSFRYRDERAVRIESQNAAEKMKRILALLWRLVVAPILAELGDEVTYLPYVPFMRREFTLPLQLAACSVGDRLPHVTWCPTGPLSSLPLHAAGIYDRTDPGARKASDFIVSSYTPSLSALVAARAQPVRHIPGEDPRVLVVSQPQTPGQAPLPHTNQEAACVCRHFPSTATPLDDTSATVETVFNAMAQHEWVHLACHGTQDPQSPTGSAFFLHDGRLELSRIMGMTHAEAELAVLSACQTAKGSDDLPEEAVHLAAGMLAAGYKSVVATMWSIADEDGPVLSDALYAALKRNLEAGGELDVAYALHEAAGKLRETVGETNFMRWVPFVHFGI
ncbi:CHAT domain-containing protein, partial [Vararia minispora EC-137]